VTDGAEAHPGVIIKLLYLMYKQIILILALVSSIVLKGQDPDGDYNPFVNSGNINPSPMEPVEAGGTALFSFLTGNTGDDALVLSEGQAVQLTVTLSRGVPTTADPLGSIGGTARNWFNWTYNNGRYTGVQATNIAANASGTITVNYTATSNSEQSNPDNGFEAVITPAQYQNDSNNGQDDRIEEMTWTECAQPPPPDINTITQPTCSEPLGSITLTNLPSSGSWTLTRYPGGVVSTGSGTTVTVPNLSPGTYSFTVTINGCTSERSAEAVINAAPSAPPAPTISVITQPSCTVPTGSVVLTGLPSGSWILTRSPGNVTINGSGSSYTDTGLDPGTYSYTVTNAEGCTSTSSQNVVINSSGGSPPVPAVRVDCLLGSGFAVVTVTSPTGNEYEYRLDNGNYTSSRTFMGVANGTHTVSVRNTAGCVTTGNPFTVSCGCVNRPSITLNDASGTTCVSDPITENNNRFGGSATAVTITENGAGTVSPTSVTSSPFSFTYTPAPADAGRTVTITFTSNNPLGEPCAEAVATYELTVSGVYSAPIPGTITHPSCASATGSVILSGLPSQGNWTITRSPGNVSMSGSGSVATFTGLPAGTYTFRVSQSGCESEPSEEVRINERPYVPSAPQIGEIVQPGCTTSTGSIVINGLPPQGQWTLVRNPGSISVTGTGTSVTIPSLSPGTYTFTVTSSSGCSSGTSQNAVIREQPPTPSAPVPGTVTPPTCPNPQGRLALSGLPSGDWMIASIPAGVTHTGRGTTTTIPGILPGTYTFTVTNPAGCTSPPSTSVTIPAVPDAPVLVITQPDPVCTPATIDLTSPAITAGSPSGLTYTYWRNQSATQSLSNPQASVTGTYYIRGTNEQQCSDVKAVTVVVNVESQAVAGPDQELDYAFSTTVNADPPTQSGDTGQWSVFSGSGRIEDPASPSTTITQLGIGENLFLWTLENGACPESVDTLRVFVTDLIVPTLITPNEDGRNDFFVLQGIEAFTENDLRVFDRRGVLVYRNGNYQNDWNGVDYNGKPLHPDTYFFVLTTGDGRSRSGYIVIRR
jgi:gliding motility-associated-like protein